MPDAHFKFVDLFAGIGGFHAALSALGGHCVWASENDPAAAQVYENNWGVRPYGDINEFANDEQVKVPDHDVLTAGFPCQPFSKSGKQQGMEEARGTLFYNIAKVVEAKRPQMVLLENVRNIAGPRHEHEWDSIIHTFHNLGYRVSKDAWVISPHKLPPDRGGTPQARDRVFICATRLGEGQREDPEKVKHPDLLVEADSGSEWKGPQDWNLKRDLLEKRMSRGRKRVLELGANEKKWIAAWDDFVKTIRGEPGDNAIPGHPIWVDAWINFSDYRKSGEPPWKEDFLEKNSKFYTLHQESLDKWLARHDNLVDFPASRRKFEWQAQDAKSLSETVLHLRPSGLRVKKATYLPALVAITQTSIIGKEMRRISVKEAQRLQGFPEWFSFTDQKDSESFKQLGNAVCVGAAFQALRAQVYRDWDLLDGRIVAQILSADPDPRRHLVEPPPFILRETHP